MKLKPKAKPAAAEPTTQLAPAQLDALLMSHYGDRVLTEIDARMREDETRTREELRTMGSRSRGTYEREYALSLLRSMLESIEENLGIAGPMSRRREADREQRLLDASATIQSNLKGSTQ
tara:strand:- start:3186 stop:3545 length:360 start_codon:yes stop_codon:yes gene_type:complete